MCVALTITASVAFSVLQERVLYIPDFRFTGWLAIMTSSTYCGCALVERLLTADSTPGLGALSEYAKLSIMTMGGMYMTLWGLRYISYSLRVVIKAGKILPVMLVGTLYVRKRYSAVQYASCALLTLGMIVFTLGDARGEVSFDVRGIAFVLAGSLLEAMAANFEEKRLFAQLGCDPAEVIFFQSLFGVVWAAMADLLRGDLQPAIEHSATHPETVVFACAAAAAGYVSSNGILVLIKHFGATLAEVVKSTRKVLTVCLSFALYKKPWNMYHLAGGLCFLLSALMDRCSTEGVPARRILVPLLGLALLALLGPASLGSLSQ